MAREAYIDLQPFVAEAQQLAGADDWGEDGVSFHEALGRFVTALNTESELTPEGIARTRSRIQRLLVQRLKLFRDRKIFEGIAQEEVRAPIFLMGLSRSGTSYFNALLASDERNNAPLHWQVWSPSPPAGLGPSDEKAAISAAERILVFEGWQEPDVRRAHNYTSTNAAEDILIHEYSMLTGSFRFFWNVPTFADWLRTADLAPAYRLERKVLQALQHGDRRDQWVLKSPTHMGQLGYLFAEFPDARATVNHRDPVKCLGSITSMLVAHRRQYGNAPVQTDRQYALAAMEGSAKRLEDMIARRKDPAVDRKFADVNYLELESDPLGQVAKVYAHYGIEFTDTARERMQSHIATNRKGKFGSHKYDITETGLRVEEVRDRFKFYTDYFDIGYED